MKKNAGFGELLSAIEQFDIEDYLTDKGFEPVKEGEWVGDCPHCGKDDKLAVNTAKRTFHCWVCQEYETFYEPTSGDYKKRPVQGAGGLLRLLQWLDGMDEAEAVRAVVDANAHIDISILPEKDVQNVVDGLDAGNNPPIWFPEGATAIVEPLPYMLRRGISMEDVRTFGLFWCSHGRYQNRLIFPVYEHRSLVYFQARAMWEKDEHTPRHPKDRYVKSLNPASNVGSTRSSDVLFNLDTAAQYPRVVITEGPIDAIKVGPESVCTFGKALHPMQVQKLHAWGVKAVDLMWDGPTPSEPHGAWPEMMRYAPQLAQFFDLRIVFLPHGDPGDWDRQSLHHLRQSATPWADAQGSMGAL